MLINKYFYIIMIFSLSYGSTAHGNIYFLPLKDGVLSITTEPNIKIEDALKISNGIMYFNSSVYLDFVTYNLSYAQEQDERILLQWVFSLFKECQDLDDFYSLLFESGSDSQAETDFFSMSGQDDITDVIHDSYSPSQHITVSFNEPLNYYCLFECGTHYTTPWIRTNHHRDFHTNEYSLLKQKYSTPSKCPYCPISINSIRGLTAHIIHYHQGMSYLDF